jgi:hypothetical protein
VGFLRFERPLFLGLLVPHPSVDLERQGAQDASVLDRDEDRRLSGAIRDVRDPQEVALPTPVTWADELAIRVGRHSPGFGVLRRDGFTDLHERKASERPKQPTVSFIDFSPGARRMEG